METLDNDARNAACQLAYAIQDLRWGRLLSAGRFIEGANRCVWKIHNGTVHSRAQTLINAILEACAETGRL